MLALSSTIDEEVQGIGGGMKLQPDNSESRTGLMVTQLHHVNVTVPPELETATKEFYGTVLGLEQVPKPAAARQSGAWYQIGATQLHLSVEDEAIGPLSSRHICYVVSDLGAAEKRFRDAGVEMVSDPRPI